MLCYIILHYIRIFLYYIYEIVLHCVLIYIYICEHDSFGIYPQFMGIEAGKMVIKPWIQGNALLRQTYRTTNIGWESACWHALSS